MIPIETALQTILNNVKKVGTEEIDLYNACGRILAEDCSADVDIPTADNSAMDGYAVRWEDTMGASAEKPVALKVVGEIPAGKVPERGIGEGEAMRIMTGAPIPEGADAVVMVEFTEKEGGTVRIKSEVEKDENVRFAGEDVRAGSIVIRAGKRLSPAEVGMLAAVGYPKVKVYRKVVAGILSTGDEVIPPEMPLTPGFVRNSNSYSLYALIEEAGAEPVVLGIVPDEREVLLDTLRTAAANYDLIISTGGVSAGDYDVMRDVLVEKGEVFFQRVRMKPGKPNTFGIIYGVPIFGLPGNPTSCIVSFNLLVRPAILKMMGAAETGWRRAQAVLEEDMPEKKGRRKFIRAIYSYDGTTLKAKTAGVQGAAILTSMMAANCLIVIPEDSDGAKSGDVVEIIFL
ncbi:MAG: gephyrin-like molybdotransferase Glp [bacterium]